MRVVVDITDEEFRELLVKTKAENISQAIKIAVESFLSSKKVPAATTKTEKYLKELRKEVLSRVEELVRSELSEKLNKVLTPKVAPVKKEVEGLKKTLKELENDLFQLKEEISSLPTESNLQKLQREFKVLEVFLADQIKAVRRDLERIRFLTALEKVNEKLQRDLKVSLRVVGENQEGFKVQLESEVLTETALHFTWTALSTEYLRKLFKDAGLWVIVRLDKKGYLITL